jgi:hypothetical protein
MTRTKRPFLKASELFLILLFLGVGFMAPTAYGSILNAKSLTPPAIEQSISSIEAEAACQMILEVRGVTECHVMDYPSLDVIVPNIRMDVAQTFCKDAAKAVSARFKSVSGKTNKVRVFSSGVVPPTAACRVPAFSS